MRQFRLYRAVLICLGVLGVFASPAVAATVTLETDTYDPIFGVNTPGELRYEIYNAPAGDTVEIAGGVNPKLTVGNILIDKNLTVEGQGADATTISVPVTRSRIFKIGSMAPTSVVTIRDLTMAGGHPGDGYPGTSEAGDDGGAIHTNADLTLDRVAFVGNRAGNGGSGAAGTNGNPGGPGDTGGPGGAGGAVFNQVGGILTVTDSTFESNSAGDGGTGGQGGNCSGCMIVGAAGAGGTGGAGQDGGAIQNTGILTVTNSTFFDNHSGKGGMGGNKGAVGIGPGGVGGPAGDGGAIHQGGNGSVSLNDTTIAGNVAETGGLGGMSSVGSAASGADGIGGGTYFFIPATVANTLYSLNTATSGSNCAGGGTITPQGANLSFPSGGCPGSFSNGNPQLGGLADNGGPTKTMALGAGSAAINQVAVGAPNCPGADQRGIPRPQGPTCDIGAFEVVIPPVPGAPAATAAAAVAAGTATPAKKKCKKGRKLIRRKCVKKKRRK